MLLFIRDWRSVLIAALAIPTSIITTFTLMKAMDFTLNYMTLLGLTLAVGIVIDDAIIVLENIFRFIEEKGYEPDAGGHRGHQGDRPGGAGHHAVAGDHLRADRVHDAATRGASVNQFGWTMAISIMVSMLVSFTLTPMLSARLLKREPEERRGHGRSARGPSSPGSTAAMSRSCGGRSTTAWVVMAVCAGDVPARPSR